MNGAMAFIDIFLSPDTKAYISQYTKQTDVDSFVLQANKNAGKILLNNPVKFDYSAVFDELCGSSEAGYPISTMIYRCICENETDFNDIFANGKNAIKEMCGYYNN